VKFGEDTYNPEVSTNILRKFGNENPKSQWGIIIHARSIAHQYSPMGIEMAKILKTKFPNKSTEEEAHLNKALEYQNSPINKALASEAKAIAEATINFYYDNDLNKTMDTLEKSKVQIKKIIMNAKKITNNDYENYTNKNLLKDMTRILDAVFMNGYPNNVDKHTSLRAHAMLEEFQLN
jgi:hypothetical protein